MNIYQDGSDIVASYSGTINTAGFTFEFNDTLDGGSNPFTTTFVVGASGPTSVKELYGTNTADFYTTDENALVTPTSFSGDIFGIPGGLNAIAVDPSYTSGQEISGLSRFAGQTFASMDLAIGTYTYSWGAGASADYVELNIGGVIPEPSSYTLLSGLAAFAGIFLRRRR